MAATNGSAGEVVDGDVMTSMIEQASRSLVDTSRGGRHDGHSLVPVAAPTLAVTPQVQARELVARLEVIKQAQQTAMVSGVDYGIIPGTDKPTLLKPGAEKLGVLFQLDVQLTNEKVWGPGEHLTVLSYATVFHAPSGSRLGYGEGNCSTRERKYAKRKAERSCPSCGTTSVIKGKAEFGGGWLCWFKRGGCGMKFLDGDPKIEGQDAGEIDNPDLPDLWNTVTKMASKRARIDAVLAVTGASALFTQDVEDDPTAPQMPPPQQPTQRSRPAPPAARPEERAARADALACAQQILERGVWDQRRLNAEMIIAKATDTSTVEIAVASIPFDQLQALHHRMADLLLAAEQTS